jgi:DeoR family transcriptional regulator, fructose operon transcriptional repressor
MWHEERRHRIRAQLAALGRVSVDRATQEFGVSRETIRRDLMEMEAHGELRRTRGGAVPVEAEEAPYSVRSTVRIKEKRMLAVGAAQLVSDGQSLFLDAGSTTAILAERLAMFSGLTVITNSLHVALQITSPLHAKERNNNVILVGGEFNHDPPATFGALSVNDLARYQTDLAFTSPFGLDNQAGATSFDPREAEIARSMIRNAHQTVLLADHSKIGVVSRVSYCQIGDISHLILNARAQRHPQFDLLQRKAQNTIIATRS